MNTKWSPEPTLKKNGLSRKVIQEAYSKNP